MTRKDEVRMNRAPEEDKSPQELRREREQRMMDCIRLKPTDRIPVSCELGFFMAKFAGIPSSAAYYDRDAWITAARKTLEYVCPDLAFVRGFTPGRAHELLDSRINLWPGHGTNAETGEFQCIEIESLGDDEYDLFLKSPADYMLRQHLPRLYGGLKVLSLLPELCNTLWIEPWAAERLALFVTDPEVEAAMRDLREAGFEIRRWQSKMREFDQVLEDFGIPPGAQGGCCHRSTWFRTVCGE